MIENANMGISDLSIPQDWILEELKNVLHCLESGSRPSGGVDYESGEIPSFGGENILQQGGIVYEPVKKIPLGYFRTLKKGILANHDVLINKDGANTGKIGLYSGKFYTHASINEHVFILRGNPERITQEYLYYFLFSDEGQKKIKDRITGSAQPGLNSKFPNKFFIYLPKSIPEQSKIAEIFSTVDEAIDKTESLIQKYQRIKQGLMQDLLTKGIDEKGNIRSEKTHKFKDSPLGRIPGEWEGGRFDGFQINVVDGDRGEHYPKEKEFLTEGYCIFLNNKNIANGKFIFNATQFISEAKDKKLGKGRLLPEDIVITTRGTVGNIAHFNESTQYRTIRINSGMIILRNYESVFQSKFFVYLWNYIFEKQYSLFQSGSAQPQLPIKILNDFQLVRPDKDEQYRIVSILSQVDEKIEKEQAYKQKLLSLKRGLMEDLLTGKLRANHLLN